VSRVLVTGGSGFVAGWCIVQLLESGHHVVATVRTPEREREVRASLDDHGGNEHRTEDARATPGRLTTRGVARRPGVDISHGT
jgi:uncharacterized protein YbjT (DUF2867 family)